MPDVIQCPECDKRFRLPASPPPTYECSGCGTLMDLSDFGGAAAEPAAAAATSGGAGAPASRRNRAKSGGSRSSGGGRSSPSRGGGGSPSRRRREPEYEDDYDDRGRRGRPAKKSNTGLILACAAFFMVAIIMAVVMTRGDDEEPTPQPEVTDSGGGYTAPTPVGAPTAGNPLGGAGTIGAGGMLAGGGDGSTGGAPAAGGEGGETAPAPKPRKKSRPRYTKVDLQEVPWHESIDEATRAKADEAMVALRRGGRDWRDAQAFLVATGRPIAGRLISEFKKLSDESNEFAGSDGSGSDPQAREARSLAGAVDDTLRQMDGWMERTYEMADRKIRIATPPKTVVGIAKRWTVWWVDGHWESKPSDPWDPMVDGHEPDKPLDDTARGGFDQR